MDPAQKMEKLCRKVNFAGFWTEKSERHGHLEIEAESEEEKVNRKCGYKWIWFRQEQAWKADQRVVGFISRQGLSCYVSVRSRPYLQRLRGKSIRYK